MTHRIRQDRAAAWEKLAHEEWELIVIGGGITGAGVAREAARRGLKTLLVEQRDYAWEHQADLRKWFMVACVMLHRATSS